MYVCRTSQIHDAATIKNQDIAKELSLPPVKLHCSSKYSLMVHVLVHTCMARRKSLAGSNASCARIPLPGYGFGPSRRGGGHTETIMASIGDSPNITCHCLGFRDALHSIASSLCRRRHVYVRAWAMRRRHHVVHGHGIRARRMFALIAFLSVTDI